MPGHSQGSMIVRVQGKERFVLIVGDTGYNRDSWDKLLLPGPVWDKEKMRISLAWVQNEMKKPECAGVLAAHDAGWDNKEIILEG